MAPTNYDCLIGQASTSFAKLVQTGKRIEGGLKTENLRFIRLFLNKPRVIMVGHPKWPSRTKKLKAAVGSARQFTVSPQKASHFCNAAHIYQLSASMLLMPRGISTHCRQHTILRVKCQKARSTKKNKVFTPFPKPLNELT